MSFADDKDGERRRRPAHSRGDSASGSRAATRRRRKGDKGDIGQALRSAYERTVNEAIPAEMLDLLGKLD